MRSGPCDLQQAVGHRYRGDQVLPRAAPKWQKELETFRWIHAHHHRLAVTNHRFRGVVVDSRAYPVVKDPLFA